MSEVSAMEYCITAGEGRLLGYGIRRRVNFRSFSIPVFEQDEDGEVKKVGHEKARFYFEASLLSCVTGA
jgi:hypothetical protein